MKYFYRKKGLLQWQECSEKAYGRAQRTFLCETTTNEESCPITAARLAGEMQAEMNNISPLGNHSRSREFL